MNTSTPLRLFSAGLALLVLAGCATNRPPRFGSGEPVPTDPSMKPAPKGPVMPPAYQDPTLQGEIVGQPIPPVDPNPRPMPQPQPVRIQPKTGTPYTIKKGESLSAIAARHRISWKRLADYNLIQEPNRIQPGQVILIPQGNGTSASSPRPRPAVSTPEVGKGTYVVQSGDSLSVIAQRYGTNVRALKEVNSLVSDRLLVGQILKLPAGAEVSGTQSSGGSSIPGPRPTPVATRPIPPRPTPTPIPVDVDTVDAQGGGVGEGTFIDKPYPIIVQEGDTLESIAENYIVTVEKIRELNNLKEGAEVKPGQKLMMPATIY